MRNPLLGPSARLGIDDVLAQYPGLALQPSPSRELVLGGEFGFAASIPDIGTLQDSFEIEIRVAADSFPTVLPSVREIAGRIPRTFHKLADGSLCLGAPLAVQAALRGKASLLQFIERCIIPYLAGYAVFERTGKMPFGELSHGRKGLLEEYRNLTGADTNAQCVAFLKLLGMKKRIANKLECPCGSGRRVGKCHHRRLISLRRSVTGRAWFRGAAYQIESTGV
jgi:hypothetical protein